MQRLPTPGSDNGTWGDILNGFLEVEHNTDGTLKARTDGTFATLTAGKIPSTQLGSGTAGGSNFLRGDGTWAVPAGGVTLDSTATDIQPLGSRSAGNVGQAADAGHVHAMPRLDQVSAPTAAVVLNSQKITGLANGTVSTDAATYGQIPTALPPNGTAAGDLSGTYPNPAVAKINGTSLAGLATGLLKNTTGTGVPSIATASDIPDLSGTYARATAVPFVFNGTGGTNDDSTALNAVITQMTSGGHLAGTLELRGKIRLSSQIVLNGGFSDVCDNAYSGDTGLRFILDGSQASLIPDASVGQAVILKGMYQPDIKLNFVGGGAVTSFTDAAMTSGSNVLTTSSTSLTGRAGQVVVVVGADAQSGYLVSVIDSITDATHAVLRRQATATVSGATAQASPVGLHYENLLGPKIAIRGNLFGGCLLHSDRTQADGSGDNARRVIAAEYSVYSQDCTMAISLTNLEADHTFTDMWISVNDNTVIKPGLIGAHFGFCDDVSILKYEGGRSTTGGNERVNLLFESCGDGNHGVWSLGDRDSDYLVKIVGNQTINGTVAVSNFGSVNRIRVSGYAPTPSAPAFKGLQLIDVDSIEIDNLNTFRLARGIHIVGSNVRIKRHFSMTGDLNPIVIEADSYNTTPIIDIGMHVRQCYNQAVLINPSSGGWPSQAHMAAGGNSPGTIRLRGIIDTPNLAGVGTVYAVDQQDASSTTVILDVTDLTLLHRNTLQGAINHAGGSDLIRGVAKGRLLNNLVHGLAPVALSKPGSGTATQNATDRTLNLYIVYKLAPAAASTAEIEVYLGQTSAAIAHVADDYLIAPSGVSGLMVQHTLLLRVPPWWYWQYTLDSAAATVSSLYAHYE